MVEKAIDVEALFSQILTENKEKIYRICKAYASAQLEAEDLFQEVVLNIWKALPAFQNKSSVDTWVYRIALNVCMRERYNTDRKQKRFVAVEGCTWNAIPHHEDPLIREEEISKLYECIRKLKEHDRALILLFLEDLPYREISAVTGLSENHIAVKIKRIKGKLFNCLKPEQ